MPLKNEFHLPPQAYKGECRNGTTPEVAEEIPQGVVSQEVAAEEIEQDGVAVPAREGDIQQEEGQGQGEQRQCYGQIEGEVEFRLGEAPLWRQRRVVEEL